MIGFVGLSHLGIVSSIAAAAKGFTVRAFDSDAALCESLSRGQLPLFEPSLSELLSRSRDRISFSHDPTALAECSLIYFSQDVPTDEANQSKIDDLPERIERIAEIAANGVILVVLSQVPPGFTRRISDRVGRVRPDLTVIYQVETLIFGRAAERAMQPERFIIGCADPETPLPDRYAGFLDAFQCPLLPMRYESAELAKISINMFLVSSITTANTLAEMCEAIGADWSEIAPALKLDKRIGPHAYLAPGLGISGGNLERDLVTVHTLAREHGTDAGIVDAWLINSESRREWVLRTLHNNVLSRLQKPLIAVWGLAYKPDTTSTKNSPALHLLESLRPYALQTYDPRVRLDPAAFPNVRQSASALDACIGSDVLTIMTPWKDFAGISPRDLAERMRGRLVIDPFAVLDQRKFTEHGFTCRRLGAPARRNAA
jgi:UDPglucose 6-dehydrogenase